MQKRHLGSLVLTAVVLAACSEPVSSPQLDPSAAADNRSEAQATLYMVSFTDAVSDVDGTARELAGRGGFAVLNVREHAARGFDAHVPPPFLDDLTLRGLRVAGSRLDLSFARTGLDVTTEVLHREGSAAVIVVK